MNQSLAFVPFRLFVMTVLIVLATASNVLAATPILLASADKEKLDPIITGSSLTEEELKAWMKRRARYRECGLCNSQQPYPADLP